jgi:sigma-B regulation protein RsbU (phosphoserine phosphatase)
MNYVKHSLARRMVALILLGTGAVLLLVLGFSHFAQQRSLLAHAEQSGNTLARSVAFQIESSLGRAEAVVRQTALLLANQDLRRGVSTDAIRRTLEANPALFGMAVALAPGVATKSDFQILYGWRDGKGVPVQDRPAPEADYQSEWFTLPCRQKAPVWTEPYYDEQAKVTMVTYSVPILHGGEVVAVITCDLSLTAIRTLLTELPLGEGGTAVLLSRSGTFVSHPDHAEIEMKKTIFSLAESYADPEIRGTLQRLGTNMLSGQPGHMRYRRPFEDRRQVAHMYYTTVPCTGWALGIIRPEAQVLAPLVRLNEISALLALVSLALLLIPALAIASSVSRPLHRLADAAERLATGDFATPLPVFRTQDEVAQLTSAFDRMRQDLRHYIADLTTTTAAKERVAGELSAAREIQMSMVPKLFPPFPKRSDLDLYAVLIPALEVGGDLYDFVLLDNDHLYIAIGDVSGKGIPASLLMAVGKTLLKSTVQTVRAPARALRHVNNELAEDNASCMFITLFCGILNLKTGDFIYANAGHNPPLLRRQNGTVERLDERASPALGMQPGTAYQNHSLRLGHSDLLVLYTDGVTEAMSPADVMFGEADLLAYLRREGQQPAKPLLEGLGRAVHTHAAGAAQSDDITALAVRYLAEPINPDGKPGAEVAARAPDAKLSLSNHLEELARLTAWIEELATALTLSAELAGNLNLSLEEWVVNVISYAYEDQADHAIELRLWREPGELRITIEDDGRPFDPTAQAEVDTTLALEHREIGGLGIYFIRKTMDQFAYRRESGHNIVTLVKKLEPLAPSEEETKTC